jgi:hypothetical protein
MPTDGTAMWRKSRHDLAENAKAVAPPADWWTPERDLLASVVDALNVLIWKGTKDAQKGQNRPKPIQRPGVGNGAKRTGTPVPLENALELLRPGRDAGADEHGQPDRPDGPEGDTPGG